VLVDTTSTKVAQSGPITVISGVCNCRSNSCNHCFFRESINVPWLEQNVSVNPFPRILNPNISAQTTRHRLDSVPFRESHFLQQPCHYPVLVRHGRNLTDVGTQVKVGTVEFNEILERV